MTDQPLYAGHYRVRITPPVGTFLMGYASRTQPSEGVHDDLYANAVALSDGARRADAARRVVLVVILPQKARLS